ncbi:hypothetical protein [Streptomyces sp. NPDC020965]|uniref:hypothetical protein n=1 Tax=Streptomyces sp. NPDC020965 TaxID=3365105 RepID=UPI0037BAAED3
MAPSPRPSPPAPPPAAAPPVSPTVYPVPAYRPLSARREADGTPLVVLMLVTTTPAVFAAVLLRPRRKRG